MSFLCLASLAKRHVFKVHPQGSLGRSSLWLDDITSQGYATLCLSFPLLTDTRSFQFGPSVNSVAADTRVHLHV